MDLWSLQCPRAPWAGCELGPQRSSLSRRGSLAFRRGEPGVFADTDALTDGAFGAAPGAGPVDRVQQRLLPLPKRPKPDTPLAEVLPLPGCRLVPHCPAVSRVEPQDSCPPLPRRGPQPSALLTSARSLREAVPVASQHQVHSGHTFRRSSRAEWFHDVCPQGCGLDPAALPVRWPLTLAAA